MTEHDQPEEHPFDHENLDALVALKDGDTEPLIALLQEIDRPLHPELRRWIAAMLIESPEARYRLTVARHPGNQKVGEWALASRDIEIGEYVHLLYSGGRTVTEAQSEAVAKYGLGEETIRKAWLSYRSALMRDDEGPGVATIYKDGGAVDAIAPLKPLRPGRADPGE